jgi:hypothetical protein
MKVAQFVRRRSLAIAVCGGVLIAVVVTSGAGAAGSGPRPAKPWAALICARFASWQHSVDGFANSGPIGDLLHGTTTIVSPDTIRTAIPPFVHAVLAATDKLAADVREAGTPKTPNGARVAQLFAASVQGVRTLIAAFEVRASQVGPNQAGDQFSLSTDLPALLQGASATLPTTVQQATSSFPRDGIGKAFQSAKPCKPLL